MNDELTIDMALPEPQPLRFTFAGQYPDLAFKLKTEFSIKESKRIQWLGRAWADYFNTPDSKLRESDHRNAAKSMTELMDLVAIDFDHVAFEALPEMMRMRVINRVYERVGKLLGADDSDVAEGTDPNGLDWGTQLEPLRAPTAAVPGVSG